MFRVYASDRYGVPLPPDHRFPITKYRLLRDALVRSGVIAPQQLREPNLASSEDLGLAHDGDYVRRALCGDLNERELRWLGFPWSPQLALRARCSVGGTLAAATSALKEGLAGNLAGGTHHAHPDHGSGYCVFNDVAVAVRVLKRKRLLNRAVVIDLDVHQGDGTARCFERDDSVFTFSIHGKRNFPFRKANSNLDVALDDGATDHVYLSELARYLDRVLEYAKPDLAFYLAGVDPLHNDRLGSLALTLQGLRLRDQQVIEACVGRQIPLVLVMAGGYAVPIEDTIAAHIGTYRAAREAVEG